MITASMRSWMQKTQEKSMQHTCRIEPYVVGEDGTVSYAPGFETICGFNTGMGSNSNGQMYETATVEATLRVPLDTYIGVKDRVTILTAYGEEIEPRTFEVDRVPDEGPTAIVAQLTEIFI